MVETWVIDKNNFLRVKPILEELVKNQRHIRLFYYTQNKEDVYDRSWLEKNIFHFEIIADLSAVWYANESYNKNNVKLYLSDENKQDFD